MFKWLISLWLVMLGAYASAELPAARDPFQPSLQPLQLQANSDGTLNLNLDNINVREILQRLAQYNKRNLIIDDAIQGEVSVQLQNVTWQQAWQTVIASENLQEEQRNNIWFIHPATHAASTTALIKLYYAKATDLVTLLKTQGSNIISPSGFVAADPRTNSIYIQDTPARLAVARDFISHLDVPLKQVLIKAKLVNIDNQYLQELGIKFGTVTNNNNLVDGMNMDMPVIPNQSGHFAVAVAKLGANTLLDLELAALESEGHGKIISSPELLTSDRTAAYIEAGDEVPYQEQTKSGATNVAFKKAVLSLKVTPEIAPQQHILLHVTVNQDKVSAITVNGVPAIQTHEVQTEVMVLAGQTIVLGGIYEQTDSNELERIPFLGKLPVVGHLFSDKKEKTEKKELLVFVTPTIVSSG